MSTFGSRRWVARRRSVCIETRFSIPATAAVACAVRLSWPGAERLDRVLSREKPPAIEDHSLGAGDALPQAQPFMQH